MSACNHYVATKEHVQESRSKAHGSNQMPQYCMPL